MTKKQNRATFSQLANRVDQLTLALDLGRGRVDPDLLDRAHDILERTQQRRELSAEHTVIGFFGATGSGKSSLFNAVIGQNLARSAARRPTTASAQAGIWGKEGSQELLDWLQVDQRTYMDDSGQEAGQALNRAQAPGGGGIVQKMKTMLGKGQTDNQAGGLILLDLPDFDSVEKANRAIVERMAGYVDVLVWVFDPQKYADAIIHQDFISPLAQHGAVTLAVLNQVDRLDAGESAAVLDSLQALLAQDGLSSHLLAAPLAVSARTGQGIEQLRSILGRVAVEKSAARERIEADLDSITADLGHYSSQDLPDGIQDQALAKLDQGLYRAAVADAVVEAAAASYRLHAISHTGWIASRWLLKFRKDPLKRLHLHREDEGKEITRSSLPALNAGQKATASSAIRQFSQDCSQGLGQEWTRSIREAARLHEDQLAAGLERAVASIDFKVQKKRWWWLLLNGLQWLGLLLGLVGLLWLTALALADYFQLMLPEPPTVEGFPLPVPTLLVCTGLLLGLVTALAGRFFVSLGQRLYATRIRARLRENIKEVAQGYIVEPVEEELERYSAYCQALEAAASAS